MATATLVLLVLVHLLQLRGTEGSSEAWLKSEKHAELGTEIQLPCVLKLPQCIGLHSIKWYRGNDRIFIYSEEGSVSLGNDDIASRTSMVIAKNTTKSFLKVTNLTLEDEGLYKCEVTYLAVNRECNNVQHITLNITVAPASIRVIDETTEQTLEDGRVLGPIIEGQKIALKCESGKGRPVPNIEWYNGDKLLESESTSEMEDYGIGSGSGSLHLQVTRNELDATFTCKVSSIALTEPLTIDIKLDVHVRPLKMDIKGVVGHVIQGSKVLLQCSVSRARPPAKVTWYNGTELLILEENERLEMMDENFHNNSDSTTETDGYLAFTASEYDNGRKFSCSAENSVMLKEGIKPMKETTIIEVMYPPIVTMSPSNITVNETEDFELFCDYQANPATLRNVIWQRDGKNLTTNEEHYEGGITDRPGLVVKNSTPTDMGRYTCILENDFGSSNSQDFIDVSVLYKPITEVIMEPDAPVNEAAHLNVSLTCEVSSGNPTILTAVRWYLDGDLLKELPDCSRNTSMEEFCDIDPSKLLLETVGRSFHGNYSCEGRNDAGWGPVSPSTSVVVHYKPGPASISYEPRQVVKKGPLNITCSVKDLGRPEATGFKWYRGQHRLADENKAVYSIEKVRLEAEANFTCMAYNEAGDGDPATIFIDVSAPPAFIRKLNSYQGAVFNSQNVSIECWVECAPICNITWQKDNKTIDFSKTNKYYVQNTYHPPSLGANDFESIQSILVWNLTAWPFGQLDQVADNGMFTCESTSNGIGPGVKSSTNFRVEFPPVNITISSDVINVVVDNTPEPVTCNAEALPVPAFKWYREGKSDVISEGRFLIFKTTFPRRSNGTFYCEASNKYGFRNISTTINVLFKPECQIDRERANGKDYVVCSAVANPSRSSFYWGLKNENDTLEFKPEMRNGRSYLLLDDSIESSRTYTCIANNSIGFSTKCERHVPGNIPWWMRLEGDILIIVIVVAVAIVAGIIVICVILFLVCRRKHGKHGKYPSQAVNSNHLDSVSEGLADPETKTFYENLPFHGIQTPPNKTHSIYDYKEHYQQQQEMQQYGYPIPSSSSSQLTLPLTRSLYHSSSVVSPLQTSYVHTNNRHSLTTQHHQDGSVALPYSLAHGDTDPDLTYDSQQQQPRRHSNSTGRTRSERRKYRKHQKQRSRRQSDHQLSTSCETSFEQVQDLGIPESYKISYPHYYEDAISECPADFPRESNRYSTTGTDPTKSRNKTSKSLSSRSSAIWTTLT